MTSPSEDMEPHAISTSRFLGSFPIGVEIGTYILTRRRVGHTLSPTSVDATSEMVMYGESVVTKAWREGVARHAALTRWRFGRRVVRSAPPQTLTTTGLAEIHNSGKGYWTSRDAQLGQKLLNWLRYTTWSKTAGLAEIHNSDKDYWAGRDTQLRQRTLDRLRYTTQAKTTGLAEIHNSGKDYWTGRDTQLGQRLLDWSRYTTRAKTAGLVEKHNSGKDCWTGRDTTRAKTAGLAEIHNSSKDRCMSLMRDQSKVGGECHATASSTHTSEQPAEPFTLFEVQEIPPEEVTRNVLEASGKHLTEAPSSERSKSQAANGKGPIAPTEGVPTLRTKPHSMKELCGACLGKDDRDFHTIQASNQREHASDAPLEVDLTPLNLRLVCLFPLLH
ncbi:hypothetical protein BHM03_00027239 [Ensete ventricosum]|nr:hypothetical protein BHM03_00027239 [Ensete ventricosum]